MSGQAMWFVSRGSGLVLLVLFTIVMLLGAATRLGSAPRRWARFTMAELHRTLSLFGIALLTLHVVTAIVDPYVSIGWRALALPFTSRYETLAVGLGTLAVDLGGAVLITSLVRRWLGHRTWRAVHYLAYAAWPLAFWHSLTAASYDMRVWWVSLITWACLAGAGTAVIARLLARRRAGDGLRPGLAQRAGELRQQA